MNMFGQKNPETHEIKMGSSYSITFLGKVMMFFALALVMSIAGIYVMLNYVFATASFSTGMFYGLFIVELGIILTARLWSQKRVINKIMFALFAFISGMTAAPIIAMAAAEAGIMIVVRALAATVLTFAAAAIFGWTTKVNLIGMRGFLMISLIGMIITGVIGLFIPWGSTMELIYSWFGVVLFAGYTMYDIQKLKKYPENMYIEAALSLYLDIFNLFLYILRAIMASRR